MTTEPRSNRIPIMLTDDELSCIDNYRFDKRFNTRAEAIRELIKAGLEAKGKEAQ